MKTKEEYKKYAREYYASHKERYSELAKQRYELNRNRVIGRVAQYKRNNRQKCLNAQKRWREEHPVEARIAMAKYKKENPLAYVVGYHNYDDNNAQLLRDKALQYQIEHPEVKLESSRLWRQNNREYCKIIRKTHTLIDEGAIIKSPCKVCGKEEVMAHHLDRIDPYNIEWLCKEHFWAKVKAENRLEKIQRIQKI